MITLSSKTVNALEKLDAFQFKTKVSCVELATDDANDRIDDRRWEPATRSSERREIMHFGPSDHAVPKIGENYAPIPLGTHRRGDVRRSVPDLTRKSLSVDDGVAIVKRIHLRRVRGQSQYSNRRQPLKLLVGSGD